MWTLISAVAGLLGSAVPEIIHYLTSDRKKKRELELLKLKKVYQVPANELFSAAEKTCPGEHNWLVASVRPVITYGFFFMFCFVKGVIIYGWTIDDLSTDRMINLFWDTEARAIFAAVVGFWFGHRAFTKLKRY